MLLIILPSIMNRYKIIVMIFNTQLNTLIIINDANTYKIKIKYKN